MHIVGAILALLIVGAVGYAGYLMIKHKGPFKDSNDPPSSGGGKGSGGGRPSKN